MTPEEKWRRIKNPKTHEDYGLSIDEDELATFEEGRALISNAREQTTEADLYEMVVSHLAESNRRHVEMIRHNALGIQPAAIDNNDRKA